MSKAYKCDVCHSYYETASNATDSIRLTREQENGWDTALFRGDVCPNCLRYIAFALVKGGSDSDKLRELAADYIKNRTRFPSAMDQEGLDAEHTD